MNRLVVFMLLLLQWTTKCRSIESDAAASRRYTRLPDANLIDRLTLDDSTISNNCVRLVCDGQVDRACAQVKLVNPQLPIRRINIGNRLCRCCLSNEPLLEWAAIQQITWIVFSQSTELLPSTGSLGSARPATRRCVRITADRLVASDVGRSVCERVSHAIECRSHFDWFDASGNGSFNVTLGAPTCCVHFGQASTLLPTPNNFGSFGIRMTRPAEHTARQCWSSLALEITRTLWSLEVK